MKIFNILRPTAFAATVICTATATHAQTAPQTLDEVVAIMQACLVITAAHDYDAEGQGLVVPWLRIGSVSAGLGDINSSVLVGAHVNKATYISNSFCDFTFQDKELGQAAYDALMADQTTFIHQDRQGICFNDAFITVDFIGDGGTLTDALTDDGHVSIHNNRKPEESPCAS